MTCGRCGFANDEGARFCGSCGAPVAAACAKCGSSLSPGLRFCTSCGEPAGPEGDSPARPATPFAGPERRRISVLFVDLENFTTLAERLDPEEVRGVQSRYFEVARGVVASFGGTIEKFIGDAVMAVWGAPTAHEDDPERAVRAALAIVHAVSRLGGAASAGALVARAAVTTGEAAVALDTPGQGMVSGDLVNVAARLQSSAPTGGVLVDSATRELAPDAAGYEPIGELTLKGRSARLSAYRATPAARVEGERVIHAGPFVGRARELRELVDLFDGVVRDRHSRLVSVVGIAGIGKSRLVWELREHLDARPEDTAWHAGRAPAYGNGITFAAVADMVRRRIGVAGEASPELAQRQLRAALDELVRDDAERRWLEPRVRVLLGGDSEPAFDRDELFAAWRRFFERVADRSPAVLVFDDLQWADPALLDFIEHLATWARGEAILVVAVARPELLDRRPTWGVGVGRSTTLHLERLPEDAMRELLLGRGTELPDDLVRTILERSGGVPLYAVEVVRILADRGAPATERRAMARAVAEAPEPTDVPDSLRGVIAARIDALPPAERRMLLSASVLGRHFSVDALAAVSEADVSTVREVVDGLVRRELLAVDDELRSPARGQLRFVQELVREVAYRTVARSARRVLHLAAARYLESRDDDESVEPLASHLLEAHRLAPDHPDAKRIARRAVAALRRSAAISLRLHVPDRALGRLEQALRLVDTNEARTPILGEAAAAARAAARLEMAERHLRELVDLHTDAGRIGDAARARAQLAGVLLMAQRNEPALVELESAVSGLGDLGADAAGVEVAGQLARARILIGDDAAGLEWAERAIDGAARLGLDAIGTDALVTRGTARFRLGDEDGGLADLRRAIADAEQNGFLSTELRARNNLAWLSVTDDPRTTLETAREGFELATTMGIGDIAVQLAEVACAAAFDTGDWDWALATADELGRRSIPDANRINIAAAAAIIGAVTAREDALAHLRAVEPIPPDTDSQVVAGVLHARAWIALVAGSLEEARRLAAEAAAGVFGAERFHQLLLGIRASLWLRDREAVVRAMRELDGTPVTGRAAEAARATALAGLAALEGSSGAAKRYRRASEAWREADLPIHLALCLLDAHRLLGDEPEPPEEVIGTLRALGADGLLRLVTSPAWSDLAGRIAPSA